VLEIIAAASIRIANTVTAWVQALGSAWHRHGRCRKLGLARLDHCLGHIGDQLSQLST
jgi:hypothetical protein